MEPILSITTLSPSTMLLSKMVANIDALLKTGPEKSTQLFGLTLQVTEKKPSLCDAHTETLRILFIIVTVLSIKFKVFKIEVFLKE